jgi:RES domain-containing protein
LTRVYRILRKPYAQAPFDGEGAYRYGGRWSSPGTRLVYASEHQSLAMLEYFVHLDADDPPPELVLAMADVPDDLNREQIRVEKLPANWRVSPAPPELANIGDAFVQDAKRAVLLVPSVLSPTENNYLLNPAHPDFRKIILRTTEPLSYDSRLLHARHLARKRKAK